MNIKGIEKSLKSSLKSKTRITLALVVGFIITGTLLANDIEFHGIANIHGNPANIFIPNKPTINGIDISLEKIVDGYYSKTTSALILTKNYTIKGDLNITNTVTKTKNNLSAEIIDNNDALYVNNKAKVSIDGNNIFLSSIGGKEKQNGSTAITVGNLCNLELIGQKVQLIGNIDIRILSNAKINLNSKDSFWYGDSLTRLGILDLTLENGAEWIYNRIPTISSITLNKNSIVNLQDEDIKEKYKNTVIENGGEKFVLKEYRSTTPHKNVIIKNLKGTGGIFKVDLDWLNNQGKKNETDKSDYIYITKVDDTAKNSVQTISFDSSKANLSKMNIGDKLYFANVKEGETSFTTIYGNQLVNTAHNNIYNYTYLVGKDENEKNEKDWYIGLSEKNIEKNKNFKMAKGAMYTTYFLGTELDTLNNRIGELKYLENNDEGIWVRYHHNRAEWEDTFKTNSNMVQLGYNKKLNQKYQMGISFDHIDADTKIPDISGNGKSERYSIGFYNTLINENNSYYDLVVRGGRINNDYDTKGVFTDGIYHIGSKYHQYFGNISGEYGIRYELENGWYLKPQTQLQLSYIEDVNYISKSGIKIEEDGMTSLIGRLGLNIGHEIGKNNYYIKADLLHEFMGDKEFVLTGSDGHFCKEFDGKETWINLGIGSKINISENISFWGDIERSFKGNFENTWKINAGFSYKW